VASRPGESTEPGTEHDSADEERYGGIMKMRIQTAGDDQRRTHRQDWHPISHHHGVFEPPKRIRRRHLLPALDQTLAHEEHNMCERSLQRGAHSTLHTAKRTLRNARSIAFHTPMRTNCSSSDNVSITCLDGLVTARR